MYTWVGVRALQVGRRQAALEAVKKFGINCSETTARKASLTPGQYPKAPPGRRPKGVPDTVTTLVSRELPPAVGASPCRASSPKEAEDNSALQTLALTEPGPLVHVSTTQACKDSLALMRTCNTFYEAFKDQQCRLRRQCAAQAAVAVPELSSANLPVGTLMMPESEAVPDRGGYVDMWCTPHMHNYPTDLITNVVVAEDDGGDSFLDIKTLQVLGSDFLFSTERPNPKEKLAVLCPFFHTRDNRFESNEFELTLQWHVECSVLLNHTVSVKFTTDAGLVSMQGDMHPNAAEYGRHKIYWKRVRLDVV